MDKTKVEQLPGVTAGRYRSFPPKHAKNKDKVARKERGLDRLLIAKENAREARRRPFVPSRAGTLPLLREYEPVRHIPEARSKRENASPGELTKHVFDEIVDERIALDEAAKRLAEAWGLK